MLALSTPPLGADACEICGATTELTRCPDCKCVHYCSKEHRECHFTTHEPACAAIRRAQLLIEIEEREERGLTLQDRPLTDLRGVPLEGRADLACHKTFEPDVAAWYSLMSLMLKHFGQPGAHKVGVERMLRECNDMFNQHPRDSRTLSPNFLIRLDEDTQAYSHIKRHALDHVNWRRSNLVMERFNVLEKPVFRTVHGMLWPIDFLHSGELEYYLGTAVSLTLIKVRILLQLQDLHNVSWALAGIIPIEIIDMIRPHVLNTTIKRALPNILSEMPKTIAQLIAMVRGQVRGLMQVVDRCNKQFWPVLILGEDQAAARNPKALLDGSHQLACQCAKWGVAAWQESPGALKLIQHVVLGELDEDYWNKESIFYEWKDNPRLVLQSKGFTYDVGIMYT